MTHRSRINPEPLIYQCVDNHIDAHIYGTQCTVSQYIKIREQWSLFKGKLIGFCFGAGITIPLMWYFYHK